VSCFGGALGLRRRRLESVFNGFGLFKVELRLLPRLGRKLLAFFQQHLQSSLLQ
jgi:hypothetical protein